MRGIMFANMDRMCRIIHIRWDEPFIEVNNGAGINRIDNDFLGYLLNLILPPP